MIRFLILFCLIFSASFLHAKPKANLKVNLAQIAEEYRHAEADLLGVEAELEKLQNSKKEKKQLLKKQYRESSGLMVALYQLQKNIPSRMVANLKKPEETIQSIIALKQYIHALQQQLKKISYELKEIEKTTVDTKEKKQLLKKKLETYKGKKDQLEKLIQENKKKAKKNVNRKILLQHAKNLAKESANLQELIHKVEAPPSKEATPPDELMSTQKIYTVKPVQGKVISYFGEDHLLNPQGKGVLFQARSKEFVFSPLSGKIVYAGPFRRYKDIIIIAHNEVYHTILTGLDRIDVMTGEWIKAGEPLGVINDAKDKNFLYVELRRQGTPVDPKPWMPWDTN
ncbi:MAG: peptidoglycan DD-metalloendopeptidase family protein [Alphaproteobacteria bacterium]